MKRLDLLIDHNRRATASQTSINNSGVSELEYVQYYNEGQNKLQSRIIKEHTRAFVTESTINLVAGQEEYDLPVDLYTGTRLKRVEYRYDAGSNNYYRLSPQTYMSRYTGTEASIPGWYICKDNTILVNPIPSQSISAGLRVVYNKALRELDVRRGVISAIAKTGTTLNTITIDLTPTLGKDDVTVDFAADILNKLDHICVVDKWGDAVLEGIPIDSYNSSTGVITVSSGFTTSLTSGSFVDQYVVGGHYTTTHSELPNMAETYLILYCNYKILRRDAASIELVAQQQELAEAEQDVIDLFKAGESDIYDLPIDAEWDDDYYGRFR